MISRPQKKRIAILGSTGSVGIQALDVVRTHTGYFDVELISAFNNASMLIEQAIEFQPRWCVIVNKGLYSRVSKALEGTNTTVMCGPEALAEAIGLSEAETVLDATVGLGTLCAILETLKQGRTLALANKESLVSAGHLIASFSRQGKGKILPVDSEHSAIFQCIAGEENNPPLRIYLTASGGPFKNHQTEALTKVDPEAALKHPNWNMGPKVSIDSATMMNKGMEAIGARWLFDLNPRQIQVVIHPQSYIHSMVQFRDGSIKAQLGTPDMKLPLAYALGYPLRIPANPAPTDFQQWPALTFESPGFKRFPCLQMAFTALQTGGILPAIMNAANEVAVEAFLKAHIGFLHIPEIIRICMEGAPSINNPGLDQVLLAHKETKSMALETIKTIQNKNR